LRRTILILLLFCHALTAFPLIRTNLVGYRPKDLKVAVYLDTADSRVDSFEIVDALLDRTVWRGTSEEQAMAWGRFNSTQRLDFTAFTEPGTYYLRVGEMESEPFRIGEDVYQGAGDFLLRYMRQQRCGYNPFLNDSCHTHDGYTMYHPEKDSVCIDVTGGWHDASDYLQYVATSANAVFQMLYAYRENPEAFGDQYEANGLPGANGIPDILDEAYWGLEWLVKMNPGTGEYYNQIADDRDHLGFRLPTEDPVSYGFGQARPVYFCTGKPQGLGKYQNRATGIASTAGKYASAFALGAQAFSKPYPKLAAGLKQKAEMAFEFGKQHPGVCQTAPCRAPYFYEEDNWVDDMELAAAALYRLTGEDRYLDEATLFAIEEPLTPWMGTDTARHYQWYPFMNMGHVLLADLDVGISKPFRGYLRQGLEAIAERGADNPFLFGVPFIWCSNNLVTATLTQAYLYRRITGDEQFLGMESALRDWLLGCNPWGTSMIVGYPSYGDTPTDPHSAFTHLHGYPIDGGLVDGPVYATIFNALYGIKLGEPDEYAAVQPGPAVYHDDWGDYSTNEPTMDGTACLTLYFGSLGERAPAHQVFDEGGLVQLDSTEKVIYLLFTADSFADGYSTIREALRKHQVKGSFFFTGNFYRRPEFAEVIRGLQADGHYLGAHSDRHLLYAAWEKRDSTLVTREQFEADLKANYRELARFDIQPGDAPYFLPPYEWYNREIADWTAGMGLQIVNLTPGPRTATDYTTPAMGSRYWNNRRIYRQLMRYEKTHPHGLNGHLLLIHLGTFPERKAKFYERLDRVIQVLQKRGYRFERL